MAIFINKRVKFHSIIINILYCTCWHLKKEDISFPKWRKKSRPLQSLFVGNLNSYSKDNEKYKVKQGSFEIVYMTMIFYNSNMTWFLLTHFTTI